MLQCFPNIFLPLWKNTLNSLLKYFKISYWGVHAIVPPSENEILIAAIWNWPYYVDNSMPWFIQRAPGREQLFSISRNCLELPIVLACWAVMNVPLALLKWPIAPYTLQSHEIWSSLSRRAVFHVRGCNVVALLRFPVRNTVGCKEKPLQMKVRFKRVNPKREKCWQNAPPSLVKLEAADDSQIYICSISGKHCGKWTPAFTISISVLHI